MKQSLAADTIIVGAGAAGAVIASRMTERDAHDVLLLEAGPDYPDALPADLRDGTRNSLVHHDWKYRFRAMPDNGPMDFPRGRVVGGSSAVNTCIALRGMPYDFDEWAERGLPDWAYERCLPAFIRLETDRDLGRLAHHGDAGPIPIRRHPPGEQTLWQSAFLEACDELGFESNHDANDATTTGYAPHPMNKIDGERMSAARCYLTDDVRARRGLRIQPDTLVRRVLFEGDRAIGVEVEPAEGGPAEVLLCERVVLCAGAIATPGVLLRSGVGPRQELARLGVEVIAHNPAVGARLLDHPGVAMFYLPRPGVADVRDPLLQTHLRYSADGSRRMNDMQLQPGSLVPLPFAEVPALSMMASVGKPRGQGTLRLRDANPRSKPLIDQRALMHPDDLEQAAEALELAWLLATTSAMGDLATLFMPNTRGLGSRASFRAVARRQCGSGYHPCGTVPMGADDAAPEQAATDGRGRVRGVRGLIVADASLMPTVPSGNIHLPTLMIGERFGEWLRDGEIPT